MSQQIPFITDGICLMDEKYYRFENSSLLFRPLLKMSMHVSPSTTQLRPHHTPFSRRYAPEIGLCSPSRLSTSLLVAE